MFTSKVDVNMEISPQYNRGDILLTKNYTGIREQLSRK